MRQDQNVFFLNLTESPCLKVHSSACDTNSALVWSQSSTRWQGIGWRFQRPDKSYHRASLLRDFPPSTFFIRIWADLMGIPFSIQKCVLNYWFYWEIVSPFLIYLITVIDFWSQLSIGTVTIRFFLNLSIVLYMVTHSLTKQCWQKWHKKLIMIKYFGPKRFR